MALRRCAGIHRRLRLGFSDSIDFSSASGRISTAGSRSPCAARRWPWGIGARGLFVDAADQVSLSALSGSEEGIMVLELNRAEAKNAIGVDMLGKFQSALDRLQDDDAARVVILRSVVPGVFCAGADLKERKKMSVFEAQKFVTSLRSTFSSLEVLSLPTIAAVEGVALGGGLELALSCDLRICGAEATFGLPETGLAIIPGAGGTQRLPRLIGRSRAKELIFTGRRIGADEAKSYGLVEYLTAAGDAYRKALELAKIISNQGPLAIKMAKVAIDRGSEVDAASGMEIEEACYGQVLKSKDRLEGLAAFAEKRSPVYRGD
ncbi:probable enoyl-CoA hydratase 2, mitochondrial isoform X1 [Selaginella moellendorffii]|nr:probable enoyl-CoA hydratase 2, mitochondrial isoform X1 [Selaginella moellendorffii]|eukprot:XP_002976279.2 probable enoyl-CoA hydratase 2, mitochondrial isoform X1 [Selaginella moellendorffii]